MLQAVTVLCPWAQSITTGPGEESNIPVASTNLCGVRTGKPGAGLGWTEPRMEAVVGLVDRRLHLRGYVGGVRKRDSKFV